MLVLSEEGICQVLPGSDVSSVQLEIPLGDDPHKTILKAVYQKLVIVRVHRHLLAIHREMRRKTFSSVILVEHRGLKFVWNY